MKILSLFDGISCGHVALERAGIKVEKYDAFEIDKWAIQVSQKNYPDIVQHGDVFSGDFTQFKGYDLLIGGSPCQHWSIAKANREITPDGEGGKLFLQYVRALKESECKYFLYENNNSIHNNIKTFISKELGVKPIMINSELVSAQQRKRCYWTNIPNVTQPNDKGILLKDIIESGIVWLNKSYAYTTRCQGAIIRDTLEKHRHTMVAEPVKENNNEIKPSKIYQVNNGFVNLFNNGESISDFHKIELPDGKYSFRKLTSIEAERLQTLPDNYTEGISNTQRYKCIGNGWTVDVIAHILKNLKEEIE